MYRRLLLACFTVGFLFSSSALARHEWKKEGWEKIDQKDGVKVYRKAFKDSDVKGVGGSALIDAPASKILWVLMDHGRKDQWVDKFHSARTIDTPSPLTSIQYAAFSMPLTISDRDFVYAYEFIYHQDKKMIEVDVKSVKHKKEPVSKSVGVRGEIIFGKYRLYPRKGGKKTYVEVEYLADPKGYLPSWVVNIVQKSWPYKTLTNLRAQVKKDFVGEQKDIMKALGL